jgi:hypothetical protein
MRSCSAQFALRLQSGSREEGDVRQIRGGISGWRMMPWSKFHLRKVETKLYMDKCGMWNVIFQSLLWLGRVCMGWAVAHFSVPPFLPGQRIRAKTCRERLEVLTATVWCRSNFTAPDPRSAPGGWIWAVPYPSAPGGSAFVPCPPPM